MATLLCCYWLELGGLFQPEHSHLTLLQAASTLPVHPVGWGFWVQAVGGHRLPLSRALCLCQERHQCPTAARASAGLGLRPEAAQLSPDPSLPHPPGRRGRPGWAAARQGWRKRLLGRET